MEEKPADRPTTLAQKRDANRKKIARLFEELEGLAAERGSSAKTKTKKR